MARRTPPAPKRTLLTQAEAADYLGVTTRTVRQYVADGVLPAYRLGSKHLRYDQAEVDALLRLVITVGTTS